MVGELFLGRQPIIDRRLALAGYELLFRAGEENEARFDDGDLASTQVLVSTFMELGLEAVVGSHRAYVNLTRPFLTGEIAIAMSPEQVALEVLEDVAADQSVLDGVRRLRDAGYRIVLDDFRASPASEPLLALAHVAKLDVLALSGDELAEHVDMLHRLGIEVVAEKVETPEMHERCLDLGCDYFQGYFFCRPQMVRGRSLPASRLAVLTLLARLEDPEVSLEELERLIVQDVTLSYRLLRYINCATFALRREIESIREAIVLLGSRSIRNWASLIVMSRIDTPKPPELLKTALVRARTCELLAERLGRCDPSQAFTVGLFSVLDAVLDRPMAELLDVVPLTMPVKLALLEHEGPLGEMLERALGHESGQWGVRLRQNVDVAVHNRAYLDALKWAQENDDLLVS